MGLGVGALTKFAESKVGFSFYKWASGNKEQKLLDTAIPLVETALVTTTRVLTTERQNLSRREKNMIERQDVIPAVVGIGIGSCLNKKVFEIGENIGDRLDTVKITDSSKIKNAIKVLGPIVSTCMLLRFVLPIASAFVSSKIEDKKASQKLDIKV